MQRAIWLGCVLSLVLAYDILLAIGTSERNADSSEYLSNDEQRLVVCEIEQTSRERSRICLEYESAPVYNNDAGYKVHLRLAVTDECLYHMGAHGTYTLPWQADYLTQEFVVKNGHWCQRWPFNRAYADGKLERGDNVPGSLPSDVIMTVMPCWPMTAYRMPQDSRTREEILPGQFIISGNCRIRRKTERVASEECWVLENGEDDRMWLSVGKGLCVVKREIGKFRMGQLLQRTLAEQVMQLKPGLWMPTKYCTELFANDRMRREGPTRALKIQVLSCLVDKEVPDSLFVPVYAPGAIHYEKGGRFSQVRSGGEDLLDDMVNHMVRYSNLPTKGAFHGSYYSYVIGGFLLGISVCMFLILSGTLSKRGYIFWAPRPEQLQE